MTVFVFVVRPRLRNEALFALYSMTTPFPDLDGLGRSMAWEFENHWGFDVRTLKRLPGWKPPRARRKAGKEVRKWTCLSSSTSP